MNAEDLELIKTIAGQVMGWQILDKPLNYDEQPAEGAGTFFVVHEGIPMSAQPFETSESYVFIWEDWNPLTTANAWRQILEKLIERECVIDIRFDTDGSGVVISNTSETIRYACVAKEIGPAICNAALEFTRIENKKKTDTLDTITILRNYMTSHGWPPGANWVAVDANGRAYSYGLKPKVYEDAWEYQDDDKAIKHIATIHIDAGLDWQELIIEKGN